MGDRTQGFMPPSCETDRPPSPLGPHAKQLPSPKRSPVTPPKRRVREESGVVTSLEKVQAEVVEYAQLEARRLADLERAKHMGGGQAWETKATKTFTAPDGEVFDSEGKYKQYMYKNYYSFANRVGETLVKRAGDIRGNSFDLADLKDCEVQLLDTGQVFADNLENCTVYVGACNTDVFVRNCVNCTFTIACKQLRLRDSSYCQIYLYSATRPALETSHHMKLAPFNGAYPRQGSHFRQAGLDADRNQWDQVHDFSKSDDTIPKPHWSKLPEAQWKPWEITLPGMNGKPENPVKRESNALWFTNGVPGAGGPIMGIKTKGAAAKKKGGLFAKIGPKLG